MTLVEIRGNQEVSCLDDSDDQDQSNG